MAHTQQRIRVPELIPALWWQNTHYGNELSVLVTSKAAARVIALGINPVDITTPTMVSVCHLCVE